MKVTFIILLGKVLLRSRGFESGGSITLATLRGHGFW